MSTDQRTRLKRVFVNAGIFAIASGASAFLTIMQNADYGVWSAPLAVVIGAGLKAIQAFTEPPQDVYR